VGVFTRNWRPFVCTIAEEDLQDAKKDKSEWVTAIPWDYKIPKIRIRTRQLSTIANARIVVRLDKWDVKSTHPQGHYVKTLGEIGKLDTEVQVLMQENGIDYAPFSGNMLAELPEHSCVSPLPTLSSGLKLTLQLYSSHQ
jgi:DIS3-like exonuclease 1